MSERTSSEGEGNHLSSSWSCNFWEKLLPAESIKNNSSPEHWMDKKNNSYREVYSREEDVFFWEDRWSGTGYPLSIWCAFKHLVKEEFTWRTSTSNQFDTSRAERSKSPEGQAGLWGESPIDLTPHTNRSLKACRVSEHGKSKGLPEHSQAKWPEDQW